MKIGLIDSDYSSRSNFPNYALMKISNFHKQNGDLVEWAEIGYYDIIYISKVFSFTKEKELGFLTCGKIERGGTGYDFHKNLPQNIDDMLPDYSIYRNLKHAYGFLTRGCTNNCEWCIVPKKEGLIKPYREIEDIIEDKKSIILMDNNILAIDFGLKQIEKIVKKGIKVDFNQGLDARIIANNTNIAQLLSKVKWINYIRLACDTQAQIPHIEKTVNFFKKNGIHPSKIFVYTLIRDINESYNRIMFLKKLGVKPFAQPFRDFKNNISPTTEQRRMARWVNHKAIFYSVDFKDYK